MTKLRLIPALGLVALAFSSCSFVSWTWVWQDGGSSLNGALGLGNNGQAYVTLDGVYIDATIEHAESNSLESIASNCINGGGNFDNCVFDTVGPYLNAGAFTNIEKSAIADANCYVYCDYGVSLEHAVIGYAFNIGGRPGCLGFKVNLAFVAYQTASWYYMPENITGGGGDPPANAFCPT